MPKLGVAYQFTKEELEEAVKQNISILGTMTTLGISLTSGSLRRKLTKLIQVYAIDTSHFLGMSWNQGTGLYHKGGIIKKVIKPKDERKCTKCGLIKLAKEFYQRKRGPRAGTYYEKCKDCMKVRGRTYYHQNHERQLHLSNLRKLRYLEAAKELVGNIKKGKSCLDCGKVYPSYVMDFDHREGEIKVKSISNFTRHQSSSLSKIKLEIAKCDLVCANCHRVRTHNRLIKNAAVANGVKASA